MMNERPALPRERLAFNDRRGTVPARSTVRMTSEPRGSFLRVPWTEPQDWGYAGLFLFTAVLLLRPQDQIRALGALHLAEVFAFAGTIPMVLHRFARQYPTFRVNVETLAMVAFGAVMLATVPTSIWPGGAFAEFTDSYVKILIVFVLMMNAVTTTKRLDRLVWLMLLCLGFVAARGVFDYARGVNLVEGGRLAGPVGGILGNPNDLALNMVTFLPAAAVMALSRQRGVGARLVAAAVVGLMAATVVFTKSRSGALGLAAAMLALLVLGRKVRPGFGAIAVVAVLVAAPFVPSSFWDRMSSIASEARDEKEFTGSREARETVMREGLKTFAEHPLTGVGVGQFKNYNPPGRQERWRETHSALIQVAAETGVGGLLVFAFLIVCAALAARTTRRLLGRVRERSRRDGVALMDHVDERRLYQLSIATTAGLVGWFTCALFASVAYNWTFYYLLALTVAARELVAYRLREADTAELDAEKPASLSAAPFSTQGHFTPA